ncbi:MAG: DUF177 domain-containing protein [bacterium]
MIINIKELLNEIYRSWEEPVEAINEMFAEEPHNTIRLSSPFSVNVHLKRIADDIDVSGKISVNITFDCDRCCEVSSRVVTENFHLILMPKKEEVVEIIEEEIEDDIELSYYEGEEINLSDYIKEALFLALPIKLLCKEDCKGICPNCGANLNKEKCSCSKVASKGSPFDILKN